MAVPTRRRRALAVAGYHLALVCLFFLPAWLRGHVFLPGDILCEMQPWRSVAPTDGRPQNEKMTDPIEDAYPRDALYAEGLKQGRLTFWNSRILCGVPFFGDGQSCQLYPPRLLAYTLLDPLDACTLLLVLHLWAAGCCFYVLLREYGRTPFASIVGSTAWAWGSYQTLWLEWAFAAPVGVWTPLILLLYERALKGRALFHGCGAGLAAGMLLLSTHLGFAAGGLACLGAAAALRAVGRWHADGSLVSAARPLAVAAGVVAAGVAVAAVQLGPCVEAVLESQRGNLAAADHFPKRWLWTVLPLALLNPHLLGSHTFRDFDLYHLAETHPWETVVYVGGAGLLLAAVAVRLRGIGGGARGWAALGALAALFAWGTTLYDAVTFILPPARMFTPGRFLVVAHLALCVLAAAGVDAVVERGRASVTWLLRAAWAAVAGLVLAALVCAVAGPLRARGFAQWLRITNPPMVASCVTLVAGVAAVHALSRGARWARPALLAALVSDLFAFGLHFNPTCPPAQVYPETPALRWLREHVGDGRVWARRVRPDWGWPMPNTFMPYGIPVIEGFEAAMPKAYVQVVNAENEVAPDTYQRKVDFRQPSRTLLRWLGVGYIVADHGTPPGVSDVEKVYEGEVDIYRLPDPMPRAWGIQSWSVGDACLANVPLGDGAVERHLLDHTYFLPWTIFPVEDEGDVVRLTVEAKEEEPGTLALAHNYARGWRAWVDGKEVMVSRVHGVFRGVPIVGAGRHRVEMRYEPVTFRACAAASLAAIAIVSLLAGWGLRRPRTPLPVS